MYKGWAPNVLDALFCDQKDHNGLYYWYDAIIEKMKWNQLKPKEQMKVTYDHI